MATTGITSSARDRQLCSKTARRPYSHDEDGHDLECLLRHRRGRVAFRALPDLVHARIASFLPSYEALRRSTMSCWLRQTYLRHVRCIALRDAEGAVDPCGGGAEGRDARTCTGTRRNRHNHGVEAGEEGAWRLRAGLLRLLQGLGKGLEELRLPHLEVMPALSEAMRAGYCARIRTLHVSSNRTVAYHVPKDPMVKLLGCAMGVGALRSVRTLVLDCHGSWEMLHDLALVLSNGACPFLEKIVISRKGTRKEDLMCLARILNGREKLGTCAPLHTLHLTQVYDYCDMELVRVLDSRLCEGLKELVVAPDVGGEGMMAYLRDPASWNLRSLRMGIYEGFGKCGYKALVSGPRRLRTLVLEHMTLDNPSLLALTEGVDAGAWVELAELRLLGNDFEDGADMTDLFRAMMPMPCAAYTLEIAPDSPPTFELHYNVVGPLGQCMHDALNAKITPFPALRYLCLHSFEVTPGADFVTLCRALGRRAMTDATPLTALEMISVEFSEAQQGLLPLIDMVCSPHGRALQKLDLSHASIRIDDLLLLCDELASGRAGGRMLELNLSRVIMCDTAFAELLKAFVRGGCRRLRSLRVGPRMGTMSKEARDALVEVLRGDAPCTDSLTVLDLQDRGMGPEDAEAVADALVWPTGARLETLNLSDNPIGDEGFRHLLRALKGEAGGRLRELTISRTSISTTVVDELAVAIREGALPRVRSVRTEHKVDFNAILASRRLPDLM